MFNRVYVVWSKHLPLGVLEDHTRTSKFLKDLTLGGILSEVLLDLTHNELADGASELGVGGTHAGEGKDTEEQAQCSLHDGVVVRVSEVAGFGVLWERFKRKIRPASYCLIRKVFPDEEPLAKTP
jgi:hypothetical protein